VSQPDYQLFSRDTRALIYGYQQNPIQRMLDGAREILIPMYRTMAEAVEAHPEADVMVNFASFRSAFPTTMEALETPTLRTIAVIAEGVPERKSRILAATARQKGKVIIGPATVGGIKAGAFRIGNTAGTIENIVASKLYRPGSVGFVAKSGGMSNECFNILARHTDGLYEGIAIGGDAFPGSTLLDHLLRYQANPDVKMMVCLGELGGDEEYRIVEALQDGRLTKPLVVWVTGTCARVFPTSVQFGHAGAKADTGIETAEAKNEALRAAGAVVPESFNDFGDRIREVFAELKAEGVIAEFEEPEVPTVPIDYRQAFKAGLIRKSASIITTISDERGEELVYAGKPISAVIEEQIGIGGVIGLLWFKRELPGYATQFIELALAIVADHGPAVSGAHNAIVTARAGKDLISSLVSGLLTVGPRFGGAIDGAARYFKQAFDSKLTPQEFVGNMKARGINIPGIGHRVKSVQNPDVRVTLIKRYVREHFPRTELLDYALEVEKVTTAKRNNLILNVDGCLGVTFVDLLRSCGCFTEEEVQNIVDLGYLNAVFVLGRSIGIMGHIFDQKRLAQPLYRHPWDDIAYMTDVTAL
jgi:succinyl-CoA synthetase alpha subunit